MQMSWVTKLAVMTLNVTFSPSATALRKDHSNRLVGGGEYALSRVTAHDRRPFQWQIP
jgi:hypothetical protein